MLSLDFLLSSPTKMGREGGILPSIVGTVVLTLLSVVIAAPLGVGTAIFLTEYTREGTFSKIVRFGTESLAGIPSIIFGLFGFLFFVIRLNMGWSMLSGALTLASMILPTVVRTSEEAIRTVPDVYREVSFALGASRWQTVTSVVLLGLAGYGNRHNLGCRSGGGRNSSSYLHCRIFFADSAVCF